MKSLEETYHESLYRVIGRAYQKRETNTLFESLNVGACESLRIVKELELQFSVYITNQMMEEMFLLRNATIGKSFELFKTLFNVSPS